MAIRLDDRAHATMARRRARGREAAMTLQIVRVPHGGHRVAAEWDTHRSRTRTLVERRVGEDVVYVDERVARYATWRDITISAWRLGPLDFPIVVHEPLVMMDLTAWQRTHPGLRRAAGGMWL